MIVLFAVLHESNGFVAVVVMAFISDKQLYQINDHRCGAILALLRRYAEK